MKMKNYPTKFTRILTLAFSLALIFTTVDLTAQIKVNKEELKNRDLKILVISDLNDSYGTVGYSKEVHEVIAKIDQIQPDLILCGGDMVAGQKASLTVENLRDMWAAFDRDVLSYIHSKGIPFGFTMGNHDASPNYHNDRMVSSEYWHDKKDKVGLEFVDDTHFPYYFSYMKNNVFFMSWDASSAHIPEEVKAWMQYQLQSKYVKRARGRIVLGHLPLYAIVDSKNKKGEVISNADETLSFFEDNKVDMYISGHQHAFYPGIKGDVTLMNCGCIGGGPRKFINDTSEAYKSYAIIDIPKKSKVDRAKIIGVKAIGHEHVDINSLPRSITGFNGTIYRLDTK